MPSPPKILVPFRDTRPALVARARDLERELARLGDEIARARAGLERACDRAGRAGDELMRSREPMDWRAFAASTVVSLMATCLAYLGLR